MTPVDSPGGTSVLEAFRAHGIEMPHAAIATFSVHLRNCLVAIGSFLTALPASIIRLNAGRLRELPVSLPMPPWAVAVVTLKNRLPNPTTKLFVECANEVANSFAHTNTVVLE